MLVVNGRWREDGGVMVIINVYAPCMTSEKEQLWDTIKLVIEQNEEARICVVGDFNSIRATDERIGRGGEVVRRDIRVFDDFIVTSGMIDLPLLGRKNSHGISRTVHAKASWTGYWLTWNGLTGDLTSN
ncbi:hypothetical protein ACS0TY_018952 [Phlomoides rotata]